MKLYSYFRSSAAYRVRIALNLKGIAYEYAAVNLVQNQQRSAEYLRLNPSGLVPALAFDDGMVLSQSTAILEYLEEQYPAPSLYPAGALGRARARALVNVIACDIHPLNNLRVLNYLKDELHIEESPRNAWYHHWIARGFEALESQLDAAPYCMGASPSMVDVYLVPQVYNALRFQVDMTPYPKIQSIHGACNQLVAFQQAAPEAQPDVPGVVAP